MQTALDALRDVVAEIGSTAPTTRTISSGAMPVPTASMALVQSEGHASGADDVLATITTTGIDQGRIVLLRHSNTGSSESSEKITISHGTSAGQIELADNASFILCAERLIALIYSGDHWVELWRNYGRKNAEDSLADRTDLGLGTASVETVATTSGSGANSKVLKVGASADIATDSLLAIDASGNIKSGTVTGGNADTLDTYDSSAFVRKADTAAQTLAANLTSTTAGGTRFTANTTGTGQIPGFAMQDSGTERGALYYDTADGSVDLISKALDGSITPRIRLNPTNSRLEFAANGSAGFESLRPGAGNGLDADTLDGSHLSELLSLVSTDSTGAGTGGSIRLFDGTTQFLVQWPGTWVSTGSGSSRTFRWTFTNAYSSAPIVIGASLRARMDDTDPVVKELVIQDYTSTTTYIEQIAGTFTGSGDDTYEYSRVGTPLVIGVPA